MQLVINKQTNVVERVFEDTTNIFLTTNKLRVETSHYPGFTLFTHKVVSVDVAALPESPLPVFTYKYINDTFEHVTPGTPEWKYVPRKLKQQDMQHRKNQ